VRAARIRRVAVAPLVSVVAALGAACGRSATEAVSPRAADWSRVTAFLDSAVADGAAPGVVLAVSVRGERFVHGTGRLGLDDGARPDARTIYDLASLTKVVGLTTAVMLAVEEGRLALDAPVQRYVPEFAGEGKAAVTVRHLLVHAGGLPAWRALYKEAHSRAEAIALADTTALEAAPGARTEYSDLGAIVLTQIVERLYGERLDSLLARRVFGPLGMRETRFLPPAELRPRIAPTEHDPWRGRILRGEVHDENASRLDGVSGHAGLFSTAADLLTFGEWMLDASEIACRGDACVARGAPAGDASVAPPDSTPRLPIRRSTIDAFTRRQDVVPGSSRALGWDTPSPRSSAGTRLSEHAYGHTGFTGTSIWIDPERELVIVILSNRVHPTRENSRWTPVRRLGADLVVSTLFPAAR
jgi:CubicO group peptidase (beta-lactamase class C family)